MEYLAVALYVAVLFTGGAIAFRAGAVLQRMRRLRRLTPDERNREGLADEILGLVRRRRLGGSIARDPVSGRSFTARKRLVVVAVGVVEAEDLERPDGVVTWYLVTRWGSPPGIARVLRHQQPRGEDFGTATLEGAKDLLRIEEQTGAVGATTDELAELLRQLRRAIP